MRDQTVNAPRPGLLIIRFTAALAAVLAGFAPSAAAADSRVFEFTYEVRAGDLPGSEAIDLYLPLPREHNGQRIIEQTLSSNIPGETGVEERHGNRYYRIHRPANINAPLQATLRWTVARAAVTAGDTGGAGEAELEQYLAPNSLVPVGHKILQPILAEIHAIRKEDSPEATARAIYDWVVDNVEYKKIGTGWGNGDTFWACSERYGNCTDFHSLFISLARSEGIPARFEIGFPVPLDRAAGEIGGYHCWVQFHLPDRGWVPVDASEAAKHPEQRDFLYGTQPADRIHFTTGRDLVLSAGSAASPLNYFVYPYLEVGGKPWRAKLDTRFSFREAPAS
jgi:transglutaminase-like putative cysteine protease